MSDTMMNRTAPDDGPSVSITFRAAVVRLNHVSCDGRVLLDPASSDHDTTLLTRALPLPLVAMTPDPDFPGEGNRISRTVGEVTSVDVVQPDDPDEGTVLVARGLFYTNAWAWHTAGALELGLLRLHLDLGLDVKVHYVHLNASEDDDLSELMIFTGWKVHALTLSPAPQAWDLPFPTVAFPGRYGTIPAVDPTGD